MTGTSLTDRPRWRVANRVWQGCRPWALRLIGLGLLASAGVVLWRTLHALDPVDLAGRMRAWGPQRLVAALGLTAASFIWLGVLEWLGLRWAKTPAPLSVAMLRAFMVNGLTHSLGANVVVASLARSWAYQGRGLKLLHSAAVTLFGAVSFAAGLAALAGVGLLIAPRHELDAVRLDVLTARGLGAALLTAVAAYLGACIAWPSRRLLGDIVLPSAGYAVAQVAIGVIDNASSAAILWLLVGAAEAPYAVFVFAYAVACLGGLASMVPGGVGVFEGGLLLLLPRAAPAALAAGFIGFRLIFYILPLMLAGLLAAADMGRAALPPRRPSPPAA